MLTLIPHVGRFRMPNGSHAEIRHPQFFVERAADKARVALVNYESAVINVLPYRALAEADVEEIKKLVAAELGDELAGRPFAVGRAAPPIRRPEHIKGKATIHAKRA